MSLQSKDIIRAASGLVADFGEKAEAEAERKIAGCMKAGFSITAGIWDEVKTAISELRVNNAPNANSASRQCSNAPYS